MHISFWAKCPQGWVAALISVAALFPTTVWADAPSVSPLVKQAVANDFACADGALARLPNALASGLASALERARMAQRDGRSDPPSCDAELQSNAAQAGRFLEAFGGVRPVPKASGRGGMDSVAVPISRTAFDARWQRVRASASAGGMQSSLMNAGVTRDMAPEQILARVNRWVNQNIAYQPDDRLYGQRDYWATASETLAKKSGDCEDFAILKMHMLRAAGVHPSDMRLMLLRDLATNADHAFLVVSTPVGDMVLDNLSDHVYLAHEASDVRPILSFSESRRWVHAMRGDDAAPALQVAMVVSGP